MTNGKEIRNESKDQQNAQVSTGELQRQREAVIRKLVEIRRKRGDQQKKSSQEKEESSS